MDCRRGARLAGAASLADQGWALLLQVAFERVHAHFAAVVAELDLAPMQAKALHELEVEQPISMRELARRLGADPSNVTGLIDRLEARGLVERRPDPNDRRIKGLALTPAGASLRQRLFGRLYSAPRSLAELSQRDQRLWRLSKLSAGGMPGVPLSLHTTCLSTTQILTCARSRSCARCFDASESRPKRLPRSNRSCPTVSTFTKQVGCYSPMALPWMTR